MTDHPPLSPEDILVAEFNYIVGTVSQANEDRSRAASFYLVSFGSFLAALVSAQLDFAADQALLVNRGFAVLFSALAVLGLMTVLQLVRLREAWFESLQAMNQIKEYFISHTASPDLGEAFLWRMAHAPRKYKPWSLGFLLVLQIAILGGASAAAAAFFVLAGDGSGSPSWGVPLLTGALFAGFQVWLYRWLLSPKPSRRR